MTEERSSTIQGKPRILVCDPIHGDGLALLQQSADVDLVEGASLSEAELAEKIGAYHAVINRSRTAIPESVIRRGEHLRVIARAGAGLDNIDAAVAQEMGIEVINTPNANTVAVAEHAFALMLALARKVPLADHLLKEGTWAKSKLMGDGLAGKTLGIVGFGRIGREVARRAKAFEMNVLVNQTRLTPELAQEWRVENVDLLALLAQADFVTLHVPMRASNMGLINAHALSYMKPTAYLINTARGGIVDEDALLQALQEGKLAGAGLDVFMGEPTPRPELVQHARVVATPHIAAATEDAQRMAALDVANGVLAILKRQNAADALGLRVVPLAQVFPHEGYHGPRVERLASRLVEDGLLVNPPVVAQLDNGQGYVVLDGATRTTAFQHLDYPHIIVQVVDMARDNVQLFSWRHAIRDCHNKGGIEALLALIQQIPGLSLTRVPAAQWREAIHKQGALGFLATAEKQGWVLEVNGASMQEGQDWLNVMTDLVELYGQWGDVERTLETNVDTLKAMYADLAGVMILPTLTADIVLQLAGQGRLMPAGITRFVIPGRILRLNASLAKLAIDEPISLKSDWLDRLVQEKLSGRQMRYYEEPIVLLDE